MLILPDNDVGGAVTVLQRILQSAGWEDYLVLLGLRFTDFEELGMPRDAPDRVVWETCQTASAVLVTGNRAGDADSLDQVIRDLCDLSGLPVITIGDAQRILRDHSYAERAALKLLDFLDQIDSLRGTGRLFIP